MSKSKYYAVAIGRNPGIYSIWFGADGAEVQVKNFPGAKYKGFVTLSEAEIWFSQISKTDTLPEHQFDTLKPEQDSKKTFPLSEEGKVVIYTDGGCIGNPGPGGYGVVLKYGEHRRELTGGYRLTTNNRMELMACIVGLQALKVKSEVVLYSDSQYVVKGISEGWAERWRTHGWMRNKTERAENPDLWAYLLDLCDKHNVQFVWVKGHAGNPENERCDELSMQMATSKNLSVDGVYEDNVRKKPESLPFD